MAVKSTEISVSDDANASISTIIGLAKYVGELALEDSRFLFTLENKVDTFVGLVGELQGEAKITNITLNGTVLASTSAFGLFQKTQSTVQLQDSAINLSLTTDGSVALLAQTAEEELAVADCTLDAVVSRDSLEIKKGWNALIGDGCEKLTVSNTTGRLAGTWDNLCDSRDDLLKSTIALDLDSAELRRNPSTPEHAFFFPASVNLNDTEIRIIGTRVVAAGTGETVFSLFEDRPLY